MFQPKKVTPQATKQFIPTAKPQKAGRPKRGKAVTAKQAGFLAKSLKKV